MARPINFILCLIACRAASGVGPTDASEARRLSKEDHRTFRGKLDPPAAGRGRHQWPTTCSFTFPAFPPMSRTHAHDWYRSDAAFLEPGLRGEVRKLVPRDLILYLHGLHLLEETSSKCERATGMRVLCPAKRDRMWAAALKDACAVHNDGGEAYNHTCTYTV